MIYFPKLAERYDVEFSEREYKDSELINMYNNNMSRVLDLACGTGRVGLSLTSFCDGIDFLDYDQDMLNILKNKLDLLKFDKYNILLEDVNHIKLKNKWYDHIFMLGNSLMSFKSVESFDVAIEEIYKALVDKGRFITSLLLPQYSPDSIGKEGYPVKFKLPGGLVYERTTEKKISGRKITYHYRYRVKSKLVHENIIHGFCFTPEEILEQVTSKFKKNMIYTFSGKLEKIERDKIGEIKSVFFVCQKI